VIVTVAGRELDVRGVIVHDPHESVVDRSDCYDVVLDREWHGSNRHRLRARDLAGPVDPLDAARMLSDRLQKGPRHHPADVLAAMCRLCPANQDAVAAVPDLMARLVALLSLSDAAAAAAAAAIGSACRAHRANQNRFAAVPDAARRLFALLSRGDDAGGGDDDEENLDDRNARTPLGVWARSRQRTAVVRAAVAAVVDVCSNGRGVNTHARALDAVTLATTVPGAVPRLRELVSHRDAALAEAASRALDVVALEPHVDERGVWRVPFPLQPDVVYNGRYNPCHDREYAFDLERLLEPDVRDGDARARAMLTIFKGHKRGDHYYEEAQRSGRTGLFEEAERAVEEMGNVLVVFDDARVCSSCGYAKPASAPPGACYNNGLRHFTAQYDVDAARQPSFKCNRCKGRHPRDSPIARHGPAEKRVAVGGTPYGERGNACHHIHHRYTRLRIHMGELRAKLAERELRIVRRAQQRMAGLVTTRRIGCLGWMVAGFFSERALSREARPDALREAHQAGIARIIAAVGGRRFGEVFGRAEAESHLRQAESHLRHTNWEGDALITVSHIRATVERAIQSIEWDRAAVAGAPPPLPMPWDDIAIEWN